jgi:hypothetical protein
VTTLAQPSSAAMSPGGAGTGAPVPRVAVVLEPGERGRRALAIAALLGTDGAELLVLAVVPQADAARCCGPGACEYNEGVREEAELELRQAVRDLAADGHRARAVALLARRDPPLAEWIAAHGIGLLLLPGRRALGGLRRARRLARACGAEVHLVS